ncbi:MAG: phenylpropionate dioxygenase-like ring-hydroxylating dioxygenase large terminal subunit [Ilumatobacter sp.]|jgi:choline monooxygenase
MRTATGLDPAAYASDGFYFVEQQRVFGQAWVCAGIADEAVAGRMLVRQVGSKSVLLTRNETGDLRGFINSCRHRGTELAEADCDVAGTIRCPYHRWGYSLDGALKATPFFDEVLRDDNFDKADFGLLSVRVDTWGVLLFVCLSDDTPPLLDWLGDLPDRMAGYRLDTWSTVHQESLEIRANWKLITENFQEYYHLTWVHPELAKVSRVADHYRYQGSGMYCGQTTTPVSGDERNEWLTLPEAPGLDESDSVSGRFVAIFPNVILSVLPNHIWMMRLDPIAPGLTRETCTMLLPAGVQDVAVAVDGAVAVTVDGAFDLRNDAIAPTRRFWADVNDEDIDIVQRGQRGLARGGVPAGPLAPRFEEPLHRFHNMLADCMTNDGLGTLEVPIGDQPGDTWGAGVNPTPAAIDR